MSGDTNSAATLDADVIVVGAGPAGVMAAVAARLAGRTVMLLEKGNLPGGTAIESNGTVWIPNNRVQRAAGMDDSRIEALEYMAKVGWPKDFDATSTTFGLSPRDFARLAVFYDTASGMLDWLVDDAGILDVIWRPDWRGEPMPDYHTAEAVGAVFRGRSLSIDLRDRPEDALTWAGGGGGRDLMSAILRLLSVYEIEPVVNTAVSGLHRDGSGRVTGVSGVSGGQDRDFHANRGVVFATGGYARANDLTRRFLGNQLYGDYGLMRNTGDLVRIAEREHLALRGMDKTFGGLTAIERTPPEDDGLGRPSTMRPPRGVESGDSMLIVDRFGDRFVDEKAPYGRKTEHLQRDPMTHQLERRQVFQVYDDRAAKLFEMAGPEPHIIKSETIDELAGEIGRRLGSIDNAVKLADDFAERLKDTVAEFNKFAGAGVDPQFGRGASPEDGAFHFGTLWGRFFFRLKKVGRASPPRRYRDVLGEFDADYASRFPTPCPNPTMFPLAESGPYYAIILGGQSVDTAGGPEVTERGQIVAEDGAVVDGLFGAGSCVATLANGAYFGGGMAIASALVGGWIAGWQAATGELPPTTIGATIPEIVP